MHAKASSFRRREKLAKLHAQAQAQVLTLKRELTEDAGASRRRKQAATERAAREREQRLAAALATLDKLQRKPLPEPKKPKPSKRRGHGGVMKMADGGGFRPAFNAQLGVDAQTQIIAAVALTNSGSDIGQMSPMHQDIQQRYATTPDHWLADSGLTKLQASTS